MMFVLGHYLFLVAHSFPRATENCLFLGTDIVRGQITWHIFAPNGGYCLCIKCVDGEGTTWYRYIYFTGISEQVD